MKETCEKYVEVIEDRLTNKDTCVLCTLYTKVCMVKAMVFLVVMYRCKSWTIKKSSTEELMVLNFGVGKDS